MYTEQVLHSLENFPFQINISGKYAQPICFTDFHLHKEIEIIKILSGAMQVDMQKKSLIIKTGDMLIINSNVPHSSKSIEKNTQQMLFQSDISLMYINPLENIQYPNLYSFLNRAANAYYFLPNRTKENKELSRYLLNIYTEIKNKKEMFETYVRGYLNLFSACLNRNQILTVNNDFINSKTLTKIFPIIDYIDKNYSSAISLNNISAATHLNEYYLCRLFKAATGQTVFNYLNHIRICEAQNLLTKTSLSITDIALSVGFSNAARFDESFKKITGITPLKYRRQAYSVTI